MAIATTLPTVPTATGPVAASHPPKLTTVLDRNPPNTATLLHALTRLTLIAGALGLMTLLPR